MSDQCQLLVEQIKLTKQNFDASYKCVNKPKLPKEGTQLKHIKILIDCHNKVADLIQTWFTKLSTENKKFLADTQKSFKTRLDVLFKRVGIVYEIPAELSRIIELKFRKISEDSGSDTETEDDINCSLTDTEFTNQAQTPQKTNEETKLPLVTPKPLQKANMSAAEFLNNASKLLPDFDGKIDNLQRFLDAIDLVDLIKGTHESIAVTLIKSKLTNSARNLITTENTVVAIKAKLTASIKSEPSQAVMSKLLAVKQNSVNTTEYVKQVEDLTKKLETAYISDGIPSTVAQSFATQAAVKAMTTNGRSEKAKLLMQAVNYTNLSDAVSKFVELSADSEDVKVNLIRQNNHYRPNTSYRGRYPQNFRDRSNYQPNQRNRDRQRNNRRYDTARQSNNYRSNFHENNFNRSRNNPNRQNYRNVRQIEAVPENHTAPQEAQLREIN